MDKQLAVAIIALLAAISGLTYHLSNKSTPKLRANSPVQSAWTQWKAKYGKMYTDEELPLRYQVFADNYAFYEQENAKKLSYKLGINQFSDLTNEEFATIQRYGLLKKTSYNPKILDDKAVPASVDWRTKNAVTPVKNQQQCGSCWAFSTTGSLEGLSAIKSGKLQSFSEQQLVDCSDSYGNQGCDGGLMDYAFQYVASQGIELESTYPYTAQDGTCVYSASKTVFKNGGYQDVTANQPSQLKAAVAGQPVSIGIEADSSSFQGYQSGVYNDAGCGTQMDHGVLIVGYNTSGTPYWIVKNSWGSDWGNNGYIWIEISNGDGVCGINMNASYPTA